MCNCLTCGGSSPEYVIAVGGKDVRFEWVYGSGCIPITKHYTELKNPPRGFWAAVDLWIKGGSRHKGDRCIVPELCRRCEGRGVVPDPAFHSETVFSQIKGRRFRMAATCPACLGTELEPYEAPTQAREEGR